MRNLFSTATLLLLLAACTRGSADEVASVAEIPVRVVRVRLAAVALPIVGTGTLGAKEELELGFKVGGVIQHIAVDPGETVRAGQVLAEIRMEEANAAVARASAGSDNAEREFARAERLYADSVVTLAQLQAAEARAQTARADLSAARFNQRYSRITAPSAGVVLERRHEPGELVNPGTPVLVLASQSRGSVLRVGLADRDVVRVREGDRATVRFDALPGREFPGTVSQVGAGAEAGTGTYMVDIHLRDTEGLVSDLVGTAQIFPAQQRPALLIPMLSLLEADGSHGIVYTLTSDGQTVTRREVTIGFLAGDEVTITAGLDSTDKVVTRGAAYLRVGTAVEVIP